MTPLINALPGDDELCKCGHPREQHRVSGDGVPDGYWEGPCLQFNCDQCIGFRPAVDFITREQVIEAVLDTIAPESEFGPRPLGRIAIFEYGHENTPTQGELLELANEVADRLLGQEKTS